MNMSLSNSSANNTMGYPRDDQAAVNTLLRARDVVVTLDGVQILRGASLDVRQGEVHVLIGPNGAGKTTLANTITGHVTLASGSIECNGQRLHGDVARRVRLGIGRKFQIPRVFPRLTVERNLAIATHRVAERDTRAGWPGGAGHSSEIANRVATELSHGQRQQLELDMVLAQRPHLAVLDEPTAGMVREERATLAKTIRALAGESSFLIVEHDMDFVEAVADRVSFMQNGEVLMSGTFEEVARDPRVVAAYMGGQMDRGHSPQRRRHAPTPAEETLLSASGLSVYHGPVAAVREVDIEVPAGGAVGILGRNGAGKTSLICGLAGLLPTTGSIRLGGVPVSDRPAWWRAHHGLALVPQGRGLFVSLSVADNLRLARSEVHGGGPEFDVDELFPALRDLKERRAGLLSGGEQQQVAIARALLRRPTVLLLDEPTEGLAPSIVEVIADVLRHLGERGVTIVLAEQHRALVEHLCTTFLVLRAGEATEGRQRPIDAIHDYDRAL